MNYNSIPSTKERANYLKRHAHCLAIKIDSPHMEKYFIYDTFDKNFKIESYGFKVLYEEINGEYEAVQIIKYSPEEIQLMVDVMGLKFGE